MRHVSVSVADTVVICDVDGTVALMGKGDPERRKPYDWDRVDEDDPNTPIIEVIQGLAADGYTIIFVSGRDQVCYLKTHAWLRRQFQYAWNGLLLMRQLGDKRPDEVVKKELYEKFIAPHYAVLCVLDDRNKVVKMWRELGLTVLQVADGDF